MDKKYYYLKIPASRLNPIDENKFEVQLTESEIAELISQIKTKNSYTVLGVHIWKTLIFF